MLLFLKSRLKRLLWKRAPASVLGQVIGVPTALHDLGVLEAEIYPARVLHLEASTVYSNTAEALKLAWMDAYASRTAHPAAVRLYKLPEGALLAREKSCHVLYDGALLDDQILRHVEIDISPILDCFAFPNDAIDVWREAVLIARYGDTTWGHWVAELLPKIAACERYAPGRFNYVLTSETLDRLGSKSKRFIESIAFCGVSVMRLIKIHDNTLYRFKRLYALSSVFTDFIPHPDVMALMVQISDRRATPGSGGAKVALLRREDARAIDNNDEVVDFLIGEGFTLIDIVEHSFDEQVQIFASAAVIFSVLGSGLAGLLFSPPGVRVIAAAPDLWGDRFFYNITQTKPGARWAEVRGPALREDMALYRNSAFHVPLQVLAEALAVIEAPARAIP